MTHTVEQQLLCFLKHCHDPQLALSFELHSAHGGGGGDGNGGGGAALEHDASHP